MKAKLAEHMKQYMAMPDVKAKKTEQQKQYWARPEVEAKKAEYRARPEVKAKKAEYMKRRYDARPEVKAKRARRTKQEQDQDAAEQAETSKLRGAYWAALSEATIKLEDLWPVALPMHCPRHRQAGRMAGPQQYLSKPFHRGCCRSSCGAVSTCELCVAVCGVYRSQWSPSFSLTTDLDLALGADPFGDGSASEDLSQLESQPDSEGDSGWVAMLE